MSFREQIETATENATKEALKNVLSESEYNDFNSKGDEIYSVDRNLMRELWDHGKAYLSPEQNEIFTYLKQKYPRVPNKYFVMKLYKGLKIYHLEMLDVIVTNYLEDFDKYDHFMEELFRVTNNLSTNDLKRMDISFCKDNCSNWSALSKFLETLKRFKSAVKMFVQLSYYNNYYKNKAIEDGHDVSDWDKVMDVL
ncbi:hypothetical protein Catovirus_1_187 [Catovirus CTV1]|uniref:Uncharacterized protein n=1 Tax=Catovirus CTV1 TaxID=1977631 RepID=A0A1V0S8V0_9VIRU|nr:hypothetical protein Catovirus_1_187 [Catovirus CTV1]